jgi:hypothetical protein
MLTGKARQGKAHSQIKASKGSQVRQSKAHMQGKAHIQGKARFTGKVRQGKSRLTCR